MRTLSSGITIFTIVWIGQLVSMTGSAMSGFALSIWAWQETGQATSLALVAFFTFTPTILLSPFVGPLVDSWNKKIVMMLSDIGSGIATVITLVLYLNNALEIWHLYALGAWSGAFIAFQFPAYSSAITLMVPKKFYSRANGMLSLAHSASNISAPALAGLLLATTGIQTILFIDILTFSFALLTLLLVAVPNNPSFSGYRGIMSKLSQESMFGFHFIFGLPPLRNLLFLFTGINLLGAFGMVLLTPMILARSGNNEIVLGSVLSALGIGGIFGGLIVTMWGGLKRRIHGVLLGIIGISLCGFFLLGIGKIPSIWLIGAFAITFFIPFMSSANQVIWQTRVPYEVQGKVFATRQFVGEIANPLAMLVAGPLADLIFEPAMQPGAPFAATLSPLVGNGPGAGIALMYVLFALIGVILGIVGYMTQSIRTIEAIIPDSDKEIRKLSRKIQ